MLDLNIPRPRPERRRPAAERAGEAVLPLRKPVADNLPRRFGDYLLTSELSEDALGHVYRAIDVRGNGEFVRMRVFDASELDRARLERGMEEDGAWRTFVSGPWTAPRERGGSTDGLPWLAWSEVHGWTLDLLLDAFRAAGEPLPRNHAFLIADRVSAALEFAHRTYTSDRPVVHGLVWPGFISVGADGDVRLAGFGLARGLWPSLSTPRATLQIGSFVAPEERAELRLDPRGDVYSLAAIVLALLTGRDPSSGPPRGVLREGDGMTRELGALLRLALAPAAVRLPTASDFRRELGKILVDGGYAPSSFGLSTLLRERLGPESGQYVPGGTGAPVELRDAGAGLRAGAARSKEYDREVDRVLREYWNRAEK